jgi:hypothetical protein
VAFIKYRYALDTDSKTVDVCALESNKETRSTNFTCLGCGNTLVPVIGEKRRKHFRHKADTEVLCSPETYLHKLAKTRFYEVYNKCLQEFLPFIIEYEGNEMCNLLEEDYLITCQWGKSLKSFDLTKYFNKIDLEIREDSFIPDILLTAKNGEKIFVEIAVQHESTVKKKNSGYRIIEINIQSEDNIESIDKRFLSEDTCVFYNFKQDFFGNYCNSECNQGFYPNSKCDLEYSFFIIFSDGKSVIVTETLAKFTDRLQRQSISHHEVVPNRRNNAIFYIEMIIKAFNERRKIRNCFLCRYHAPNRSNYEEKPIFCKYLKKGCNSNEAASCQSYRADPKVFPGADE